MAKAPTKAERAHMSKIADMDCMVCGSSPVSVHHALTGMGGRKNHMKVLPLCEFHHQGEAGIHTLGRKVWELAYGTEEEMLSKLEGAYETHA